MAISTPEETLYSQRFSLQALSAQTWNVRTALHMQQYLEMHTYSDALPIHSVSCLLFHESKSLSSVGLLLCHCSARLYGFKLCSAMTANTASSPSVSARRWCNTAVKILIFKLSSTMWLPQAAAETPKEAHWQCKITAWVLGCVCLPLCVRLREKREK